MALYFKDTEITNIDNLVPQSGLDITDMWFGTTNVFTVWAVYDGALPAALNANGDDMRQYQIYGATGGVGDDSGTPYGYEVDISVSDGANTATTPIYIYIGSDPLGKDEYIDYQAGKVYRRTENELDKLLITNNYPGASIGNIRLSVKPNTSYTLKTNCPRYRGGALIFLDSKVSGSTTSDNGVWDGQTRTITSTSEGVLYVRYRGNGSGYDLTSYLYMLTEGATPPETYIPYLQPTDPPVALPALPTCEGTTIVDYMGESQVTPEKVLLKYRKENF